VCVGMCVRERERERERWREGKLIVLVSRTRGLIVDSPKFRGRIMKKRLEEKINNEAATAAHMYVPYK
jgi:hypothetical protein